MVAGSGGNWKPAAARVRYPRIARACFHLNWIFLIAWGLYLGGPDVSGLLDRTRGGALYALFTGSFFLLHFILISTGIIALFVVIIEVHSRRPVAGFPSVLAALALPILSFLYFAARYLAEVGRWLEK